MQAGVQEPTPSCGAAQASPAGAAPTPAADPREAVRARKPQLLEDFGRHLGPSLLRLFRFMGLDTLEWDGEGAVCRDVDGREYLDFNGCVGTLFLGRRHPRVVAAVREVLAFTPPELASDLIDRGMVLVGGGSRLRGLDTLLARETGLPARVASEPEACVVLGAGRLLG